MPHPCGMRLTGEGVGTPRRHLEHERAYSPNTIAAYGGDLADLVRFAATRQVEDVEGVDLELLRDWLWEATECKLAPATSPRRGAATRSLTAWLPRTEPIPPAPGARLRAPKAQGRLPRVVGDDQLRG